MEDNLCWIGFSAPLNPLEHAIKLDLEKSVDKFREAQTGLAAVSSKPYSVILITDDFPDVSLPGVPDFQKVGCYLIEQIRRQGQNITTPIIVVNITDYPGLRGKKTMEEYMKAGANRCVSLTTKDFPEKFAGAIRELYNKP